MYPLIRLAKTLLLGRRRSPLAPGEPSILKMMVWPWDCDLFMEVNNGRHLTLFDLGRFDLGARTGLLGILKERRWGLVVAGSTIRYRKRLTPFQRYEQHTHLVARDERWFYFVQTTVRKGEACSSALIRTGVTARGRVIASQEVAEALGHPDWNPPLPDWVASWADGDKLRPWPPNEI